MFGIAFWLLSLAISTLFFLNFRITISIICILVLLCTITSTVCYTKIYLTLHRQQAQVQAHIHLGQPSLTGIPLNIGRYRKTVSSALWVQITMVVCYLPYVVVAMLGITRLRTEFLELLWELAISLIMLNSTLNPFLYCWKMRDVRQAVNDTIKQFCCCSK